jgi:hypothetical protein
LQNDQHASLDPRCKREEWAAYGIDHRMLSYWQDLAGQDSLYNVDVERQFNIIYNANIYKPNKMFSCKIQMLVIL